LGEMYVDISVHFVLELIRMAIDSNSGISWCLVWGVGLDFVYLSYYLCSWGLRMMLG